MHFRQDLELALRGLRKSPGLVAVVVLSLGLGIGVNTTAFNLFNLMVLVKPSAAAPDRLIRLEPGNSNQISYPNYRDLGGNRAFDGMVLSSGASLNWRNDDSVHTLSGFAVSANYFQVLGVQAWLGRTFTARESAPERDPQVAVLGYDFWHNRLQGDRGVVGRTLTLNGRSFTVLGVLGRDFRALMQGPMVPAVIIPLGPAVNSDLENRQRSDFTLVGRMANGTNRMQAQAAFTSLCQGLEAAWPKENRDFGRPGWTAPVYGLGAMQSRNGSPTLLVGVAAPFVIAGLLLLIACANVAGVMLARGAGRQREIAVRLALGASRGRVVQTLLAESLVLSMLGAAGGLWITSWVSPLVSRLRLPNTPVLPEFDLHMDGYLALFTLAVALATCLMCGLFPARRSTRLEILPRLKQASAQGGSRGRLRRLLVGAQVTASVLLLIICALFLRSLLYVREIDPGFDIGHGVVAQITPEQHRFGAQHLDGLDAGQEALHLYAEQMRGRAAALPGVAAASYASLVPLGGDSVASYADVQDRPGYRSPMVELANVGPRYFQTMGIRVLRGREFGPDDRTGSAPVAIVNQTFARQAFPNQDALGKRIRLTMGDREPWREIVGVAADNKYAFYAEAPAPQVFSPFLQTGGRLFLLARAAGPPAALVNEVARAVALEDRTAIVDAKTLRDAAGLEFALRRLSTALLGSMGALGLLLAMIGLYGVLSWEVSCRTAEIGIRMALGASRGTVSRMVLRDGILVVAGGIGAGTAMALLVTLPLRAFLAGVSPADPSTILGVAAIFAAVSVAACWFPVRRATRIDPLAALRYE